MRVALVHDYLTHLGGAERVLSALMELYPNAPVYTMVYDVDRVGSIIDKRRVRSSFLQRLPGARQPHRYFPLGLMPLAVEQFDLSQFDVVLSASHSFGKGVVVGPDTMHIAYCFTPTRYAWDDSHRYVREFAPGKMMQRFAPMALSYVRLWDYYAAQRAHAYITLSSYVSRRISKYYRRSSQVIAPPVELESFDVVDQEGSYYLIVARLVPYKRIELAIDACEKLGRPLKIVGVGPEEESLKSRSGRWTSWLGFVPDHDLPLLYQGAKALLFPQEEDFGITPLEAAACGKPTIAYRAGGALETIKEDETGQFFNKQDSEALADAILNLEGRSYDAQAIRRHAESFSRSVFTRKIKETVDREYCTWRKGR